MDPFLVVGAALAIAGFSIRLVYISRAEPRQRMLRAYSQQVGLALVPEVIPEISRRLYRRERAGIFGSMIGALIGTAALVGMDASHRPWSGILAVVAIIVGFITAVILSDSRSALAPVPEAPRLARSQSPRLADYATPVDRTFSLSLLALATVGYIAVLGVTAINPERVFDDLSVQSILWPAGLLLALATAASLLTWAATNVLLDRGQPASSHIELAWSDAFRSTTLRSLVGIPGVLAAMSSSVLLLSLSDSIILPAPGSIGEILAGAFPIMGPVLVLTLVAWSIASLRNRNTTHYLRRLWPETALELDRSRSTREPVSSNQQGDQSGEDRRTKTPA